MASSTQNLGGYDYKFVSEAPDALICLICTFVAKDPQQMDCCGKVYCRLCLTEHKKHSNKCPQCRKEGSSFNDKKSERDIKALKVKCNNLDNGCQWVGELRSLEEHLQTCDYVVVCCTNECKKQNEVFTILRKDLVKHLTFNCPKRLYECQHCGEWGVYEERTNEHFKICPKVTIECPNDICVDKFQRFSLDDHRRSCNYEKLPCKYTELGCKVKPYRKDVKQHEENYQLHFQITAECLQEYKKQLQQVLNKEKFKFKLTSFKENKDNNDIFYSNPFSTSQIGYRLCILVYANGAGEGKGTHVSVFASLMKGDNDDSLSWPFTGMVTVELLNQLEDKDHRTASTTFPADTSYSQRVTEGEGGVSGYGHLKFIAHSDLQGKYLVDDTLFFRVSVDVPNYKPWLECTPTD